VSVSCRVDNASACCSTDTLRKESPLVGLVKRAERDRVFRSVRGRGDVH
jgi:hypothetical protein